MLIQNKREFLAGWRMLAVPHHLTLSISSSPAWLRGFYMKLSAQWETVGDSDHENFITQWGTPTQIKFIRAVTVQ